MDDDFLLCLDSVNAVLSLLDMGDSALLLEAVLLTKAYKKPQRERERERETKLQCMS